MTDEKNQLLNKEKLAFFCDFYQNDTKSLLNLATKLDVLKNIAYE